MKAVIDADQMCYSCGFSTEGEPVSHALYLVDKQINKTVHATGASDYQVYIKGKGNFREEVIEYKAQRPTRKPEHYKAIREHLLERHCAETVDGMEVDDKVSIELYTDYVEAEGSPDLCTITLCSPDKDLNNTPGWHYNPMKDTLYWVTPNQAMRHFLYQMLTGDRVDNVPGLPYISDGFKEKYSLNRNRLGKKTAKVLMGEDYWKDAFQRVLEAYQDWGKSEQSDWKQYMQEQGTLLWMLREVDEFNEPVMFDLDRLIRDSHTRLESK